jgi:hypothetical protein
MDRLKAVLKQLPQFEVNVAMNNGLQIDLNLTSTAAAEPSPECPAAAPSVDVSSVGVSSVGAPLLVCAADAPARAALCGFLASLGINPLVVDVKTESDVWQLQLARELRRAGVPVDLNKLA